jgi:hypothetical protein
VERLANGYTAIIGHGGDDEDLNATKEVHGKDL